MTASECINPLEVRDSDYGAYLDGERLPTFVQHLHQCSFCQNELAAYTATDAALKNQLQLTKPIFRADCLDSMVIGEYALQMLGEPERKVVQTHLATCLYCTTEYLQIEQWQQQSESEAARPVGQDTPGPAEVRKWLGRVIATVLSVNQPVVARALRGVHNIPVVYAADGLLITLRVQGNVLNSPNLQVAGEVANADDSELPDVKGAQARLLQGEKVLAQDELDEMGNFFFDKIKAAQFDLEIALPDRIVVIPELGSDAN